MSADPQVTFGAVDAELGARLAWCELAVVENLQHVARSREDLGAIVLVLDAHENLFT